jgi:hypothetical protein
MARTGFSYFLPWMTLVQTTPPDTSDSLSKLDEDETAELEEL